MFEPELAYESGDARQIIDAWRNDDNSPTPVANAS
jgi:hypothetical protein